MLYERREYICFFHHHILKVAHAWHLGAQLIIFFNERIFRIPTTWPRAQGIY